MHTYSLETKKKISIGIDTEDLLKLVRQNNPDIVLSKDAELVIMHVEGGVIDVQITDTINIPRKRG